MASKKKQPDGIALLSLSSIYGDEDDELEDLNDDDEDEEPLENDAVMDGEDTDNLEDDSRNNSDRIVVSDSAFDNTPPVLDENRTPKPLNFGASTPQQSQVSLASPPPPPPPPVPQQLVALDSNRSRKGTLTIVDYGHDEVAMSPEAEEGEIVSTGRVMFGAELQTSNGDFQEKTPPGTVQILTPSFQGTPPSSEELEPSRADAMNHANESEFAELEEPVNISVEVSEDVEPLDRFLPPPPKAKCSDELQEKIRKFLEYKRRGKSFNAEVRNRKEYRNPDFLLHAVMYQGIDQIGSCFSKDVFNPHGYDTSDYYDAIEVDMKREMERKEQERKRSPKVEFLSGGTHPGTVASAPKISLPIPGISTVGLHSVTGAVDAVGLDGRQNKKSKWDKVDGDRRNPLPSGGQDSVSAVGAHAALLSAANAGTGYTAFAQQRRREAEERRSSDKRLDRRS